MGEEGEGATRSAVLSYSKRVRAALRPIPLHLHTKSKRIPKSHLKLISVNGVIILIILQSYYTINTVVLTTIVESSIIVHVLLSSLQYFFLRASASIQACIGGHCRDLLEVPGPVGE